MQISYSNHIQGVKDSSSLAGVSNHNERKYSERQYKEYMKEKETGLNIPPRVEHNVRLRGSGDILQDTKKAYEERFKDSIKEYNEQQTRNDRKKDEDYFKTISQDDKKNLVVEHIIQFGDKEYWKNFPELEDRQQMTSVFEDQVKHLESMKGLEVISATVHYDEASPHLHVVTLPYKDDYKKGQGIQVSQRTVYNRESLSKMQDEMRARGIEKMRQIEKFRDVELKEKEQGRKFSKSVSAYGRYLDEARELAEKNKEIQQEIKRQEQVLKEIKEQKNKETREVERLQGLKEGRKQQAPDIEFKEQDKTFIFGNIKKDSPTLERVKEQAKETIKERSIVEKATKEVAVLREQLDRQERQLEKHQEREKQLERYISREIASPEKERTLDNIDKNIGVKEYNKDSEKQPFIDYIKDHLENLKDTIEQVKESYQQRLDEVYSRVREKAEKLEVERAKALYKERNPYVKEISEMTKTDKIIGAYDKALDREQEFKAYAVRAINRAGEISTNRITATLFQRNELYQMRLEMIKEMEQKELREREQSKDREHSRERDNQEPER